MFEINSLKFFWPETDFSGSCNFLKERSILPHLEFSALRGGDQRDFLSKIVFRARKTALIVLKPLQIDQEFDF